MVSSALGASAAGTGRVVLVIGDLSFYHDMNGLLAARRHGLDLLVVLVNNDGGGIFSFLPQAEQAEQPSTSRRCSARRTGWTSVRSWKATEVSLCASPSSPSCPQALADGMRRTGLQVVEVPTERRRNVELHRQVWRVVADALAPAPVG